MPPLFPLGRLFASSAAAGAAALFAARGRRRKRTALRTAIARMRAAERELALARQRQHELLDGLGVVVYQTDAEGRWTYLSDAWRRLTGYDVASAIGQPMSDFLAPEARATAREHLALHLRSRDRTDPVPVRLTLVRRDGGRRVVELRGSQLSPAETQVEGLAGTLTDVTVQVEIEQRLARQQHLYRLLAENDSDLTCVLDPERRFTYVSPSSTRLLGYSPEAVMRDGIPLHPDDEAAARGHVAAALAGEERRYMLRLRHDDGRWLRFECTAAPLVERDGRPAGISITGRDVTARVHAEEARRRSEERTRMLVDRAAYGIYTASLDGRFHAVNPALVAMLGFEQETEVLALSLRDDVFDDPAGHDEMMRRAVGGTLADGVDVRWRRRDGDTIVVRVSLRVEREQQGAVRSCEGIVENVTERLRQEEIRRRSERMASLGRMLAGAAHELNNPLAAITGFAQLLLREAITEEGRQSLETIVHEAERAAAIVRELLTFSRPEAGGERQRVDLNRVARYIAGTRSYALDQAGIELSLETTAGTLEVLGGAAKLEQVLLNLLVNAEQALEAMGEARTHSSDGDRRRPRITLRTLRLGELALLELEDNGPGIPADQLPLIWDPFWTTKEAPAGTGLGLPVVHEIVQAHAGTIDVRSRAGHGTCFRVALPLAPPEPEATHAAMYRARRPLDILVLDGDEEEAALLTRYFAARGHAVIVAHDEEHGLRLAGQGAPDALIIDAASCEPARVIPALAALPLLGATRLVLVGHAAGDAPTLDDRVWLVAKPYDLEQLRRAVEGD